MHLTLKTIQVQDSTGRILLDD
eukprot:SAG22_NODE_17488_length_304_cov_0.443902_1_plen_21_part_10